MFNHVKEKIKNNPKHYNDGNEYTGAAEPLVRSGVSHCLLIVYLGSMLSILIL